MESTAHLPIRSISNPLPGLMCFEHFLWTYDTEPIFIHRCIIRRIIRRIR